MNRFSALRLFDFGAAIEKYQSISNDITNFDLYNATINIIDFVEEFILSNSKAEIENSKSLMSLVHKIDIESKKRPRDVVDDNLLLEIKEEIIKIKIPIKKELEEKIIAYPDSKKIEINDLIKNPQNLFSNTNILLGIPNPIMIDFISFCSCYAYGLYTSSAIHILKATENYNIHFFEKISNENVSKSIPWGTLIKKTEMKLDELDSKNQGFKNLKESLNYLKNNNRIKIIHKNKIIYNENEAHEIFEECRLVITKMYYILKIRGLIMDSAI